MLSDKVKLATFLMHQVHQFMVEMKIYPIVHLIMLTALFQFMLQQKNLMN